MTVENAQSPSRPNTTGHVTDNNVADRDLKTHLRSSVDLLVVGGGINGAGIALDALGRGLSVRLVEQNDFASATSSNSSKLIHGGLRYLEYYEFRLVREALAEREVLLHKAPHLVKPLRFILPHRPHLRPTWLIRCGLFLYDTLGGRSSLARSRSVRFGHQAPLKPEIKKGFEYTDCWVDDARLVIANLMDARERGGQIDNYVCCQNAKPTEDGWLVTLRHTKTSKTEIVQAKCLVNASGPWAQSFIEGKLATRSPRKIRLIKGSHIIVPRTHTSVHSYILQNEDQRIVFVIPYLNDFTIIGTTDKEHQGPPETVAIDDEEIEYLLKVYNNHFRQQLTRQDIVADYSGVRPLCDDESDDPSAITRDYTLELERVADTSPLLSIFGGKLTTYRKLAEAAMRRLTPVFPRLGESWTRQSVLPGGDAPRHAVASEMAQRAAFVPEATRERWLESYGTRYRLIVGDAQSWPEMGEDFGGGLTAKEVDYLCEQEWALTPEDILKRRTKLYLIGPANLPEKLQRYLAEKSRPASDTALPC
jgi:glycerol-3-phosphate dehydrogenase